MFGKKKEPTGTFIKKDSSGRDLYYQPRHEFGSLINPTVQREAIVLLMLYDEGFRNKMKQFAHEAITDAKITSAKRKNDNWSDKAIVEAFYDDFIGSIRYGAASNFLGGGRLSISPDAFRNIISNAGVEIPFRYKKPGEH